MSDTTVRDRVEPSSGPATYRFDDRDITWRKLDFLGSTYFVYAIDEAHGVVDVLFKFAANRRGVLHRHLAPYITFVLQGELRFYRPDGTLKEIRPTGSYVQGIANGEPHSEGAGDDQDAIVFFSVRNVTDGMFAIMDESTHEVTAILGLADFRAQLDDQVASGASAKVGSRPA